MNIMNIYGDNFKICFEYGNKRVRVGVYSCYNVNKDVRERTETLL